MTYRDFCNEIDDNLDDLKVVDHDLYGRRNGTWELIAPLGEVQAALVKMEVTPANWNNTNDFSRNQMREKVRPIIEQAKINAGEDPKICAVTGLDFWQKNKIITDRGLPKKTVYSSAGNQLCHINPNAPYDSTNPADYRFACKGQNMLDSRPTLEKLIYKKPVVTRDILIICMGALAGVPRQYQGKL
jgi:hypothetical protein